MAREDFQYKMQFMDKEMRKQPIEKENKGAIVRHRIPVVSANLKVQMHNEKIAAELAASLPHVNLEDLCVTYRTLVDMLMDGEL